MKPDLKTVEEKLIGEVTILENTLKTLKISSPKLTALKNQIKVALAEVKTKYNI
jgi:hypothetical protein